MDFERDFFIDFNQLTLYQTYFVHLTRFYKRMPLKISGFLKNSLFLKRQ
jgi:hypothetical protein